MSWRGLLRLPSDYIHNIGLRGKCSRRDNRPFSVTGAAMFGRLFKFFTLCLLAWAVARWFLKPSQRRNVHELVSALAIALLISAGLFCVLYWLGWHTI